MSVDNYLKSVEAKRREADRDGESADRKFLRGLGCAYVVWTARLMRARDERYEDVGARYPRV